jgi:hypothetical protein
MCLVFVSFCARTRVGATSLLMLAVLAQPALAADTEADESDTAKPAAASASSEATSTAAEVTTSAGDAGGEGQGEEASTQPRSMGSESGDSGGSDEEGAEGSGHPSEAVETQPVARTVDESLESVDEESTRTTADAKEAIARASDDASRPVDRVGKRVARAVRRPRKVVRSAADRAERTLGVSAAPVIDKARAAAGRATVIGSKPPRSTPRHGGPSNRAETGAPRGVMPSASSAVTEAGKSARTPTGGSVGGGIRAPVTPGGAVPMRSSIPVAQASRLEAPASRVGRTRPASSSSAAGSPGRPHGPPVKAPTVPPADPLGAASSSGGISTSTSSPAGAAVLLLSALVLAAASLAERLRLPPARTRPVAFVSLLDRPG